MSTIFPPANISFAEFTKLITHIIVKTIELKTTVIGSKIHFPKGNFSKSFLFIYLVIHIANTDKNKLIKEYNPSNIIILESIITPHATPKTAKNKAPIADNVSMFFSLGNDIISGYPTGKEKKYPFH